MRLISGGSGSDWLGREFRTHSPDSAAVCPDFLPRSPPVIRLGERGLGSPGSETLNKGRTDKKS